MSVSSAIAGVMVDRLHCEYLENPLGIDFNTSQLSWNLKATIRELRGVANRTSQIA